MSQLHYLSSFVEVGVSDLDASVRWYRETLGFQLIATYGDAVHLAARRVRIYCSGPAALA